MQKSINFLIPIKTGVIPIKTGVILNAQQTSGRGKKTYAEKYAVRNIDLGAESLFPE